MRRLLLPSLVLALLFPVTVAAADEIQLYKISETSTTITLGWTPVPGLGYTFYRNDVLVSRTNDPTKNSVKFTKGDSYGVRQLIEGKTGSCNATCAPTPPPGDTTPPSTPAALTASTITQTSVTLNWGDSTDNVGVTNYRIFRDNVLIGQGPGSAGGFQNAWTDNGRTCNTNYVYAVDAQDAAGNTSSKATLSLTTLACDSPPPPPPPSSGCVSTAPATTITGTQLEARMAVSGAFIDNVTVSGSTSVSVSATNVTLCNSRLSGFVLDIDPGASGFHMASTNITNGGWNIWGADNVLIENGIFDGGANVSSNQMWDTPAGNGPKNIIIRNNTFKDYRGSTCLVHGEALFLGGFSEGLIEGNTFTNNGCTSHIFFSHFGNTANSTSYPRNWCIRGNTFGPRFAETYFDINFRDEVVAVGPAVTNIKIQPGTVTTNPEFDAVC